MDWAEARMQMMDLMRTVYNTRRGRLRPTRNGLVGKGGYRVPPELAERSHEISAALESAAYDLAFCERGIHGFAEIIGEAVARQAMQDAVDVLCR